MLMVSRVVGAEETLNYSITIQHNGASLASAFDVTVTLNLHKKLLPEDDRLLTSLPLASLSTSQQSDGSHVLTTVLEEFQLDSGSFELTLQPKTVSSLLSGDVMNCSVQVDYYSSPSRTSCSRRSYTLRLTAFLNTCARNLVVNASVYDSTTAVAQRLAPGERMIVRVSSIVQEIGKQQVTVSVTVEHTSLTIGDMSDIWRVIDVISVTSKSVLLINNF